MDVQVQLWDKNSIQVWARYFDRTYHGIAAAKGVYQKYRMLKGT